MPPLPPPVTPPARIGVAALSGPVDGERLERGMDALRRQGFEPVPAANLRSRHGIFAGTDDERLEGFHALARDRSIEAILFARGGYGVMRLLPRIDWDLLAARPRAYVGYSDLTPFLLAVVARLDLAAFHGPMVAADLERGLTGEEEESFLDALAGRLPVRIPVNGWLRQGPVAEGPLIGGCLSLLTATLGTPWAPPLDGAILFWEDVGEPIYRLDRMLTHLDLSGNLGAIRGMVVGHCRPDEGAACGGAGAPVWPDHLAELTRSIRGPVAVGLPAGHEAPNRTLPLGASARLDPSSGGLLVGLPAT